MALQRRDTKSKVQRNSLRDHIGCTASFVKWKHWIPPYISSLSCGTTWGVSKCRWRVRLKTLKFLMNSKKEINKMLFVLCFLLRIYYLTRCIQCRTCVENCVNFNFGVSIICLSEFKYVYFVKMLWFLFVTFVLLRRVLSSKKKRESVKLMSWSEQFIENNKNTKILFSPFLKIHLL
jgi:hypothetical protein